MTRVVFLGFDSADPNLIDRWGEEGLMPAFHSLRTGGLRGTVTMSPGLGVGTKWVSLYSGNSPARHRYLYSRLLSTRTYRSHSFGRLDVQARPFWQAVSEAGRKVAIVDFPLAAPSRDLNGIEVNDWGTHDFFHKTVQTWPPDLADFVVREFGVNPTGRCDFIQRDPISLRDFRNGLVHRIRTKTELIRHFLEHTEWDLFAAVFSDAHCICHQCWHLHDPTHPRHDAARFETEGDPVRDVFMELDQALGKLLAHMDRDTLVTVYAGSGMGPNYTGNHLLDEILRRIEKSPTAGRISLLRALKWTYRRALPMQMRLRMTPLANIVDETTLSKERRRRRFFAVPNNDICGAIRFNLRGREAHGLVDPGAEFDDFCAWLTEELSTVINAQTGAPLVRNVIRSRDYYHGPYLDDVPDLFVDWNRDRPIERVFSPTIGEFGEAYISERTGDHRPGGAFFVCGPGIPAGEQIAAAVPVENIAPTLAAALGVSLGDIDGIAMPEICAPST